MLVGDCKNVSREIWLSLVKIYKTIVLARFIIGCRILGNLLLLHSPTIGAAFVSNMIWVGTYFLLTSKPNNNDAMIPLGRSHVEHGRTVLHLLWHWLLPLSNSSCKQENLQISYAVSSYADKIQNIRWRRESTYGTFSCSCFSEVCLSCFVFH